MSLIIIEGLDGTGKTSLANRLKDELGYGIAFGTSRKNTEKLKQINININDYHEDVHFINQWSSIGFNAICDRSFISAVVYGDINEKTSMIFNYCLEQIEKQKDDVYFILLKAKNGTIVKRDSEWKDRENELETKRYLYENIFENRLKNFKTLVIHTDNKTNNKVYKEVKKWLKNFSL